MGVHQTPTSRLKKRKRHVSVFDFDFDLDLPKHKPALEMQWHVMFSFPSYKPQRPEVFKGLVSMCSELIAALEDASGKAGRFVTEVYECLRKEQHLRYARMVIDTICTKQEMVVRKICEAKNMFIHVKKDVVTYVDSIDNMVLNRYRAMCQYYEKLGQLAEVAFEEADAKLKEWILNSEPFFLSHVDSLLHFLRCVVVGLTITHKQLELLYEKNVIVTGYYEGLYGDWKVACATPVWKVASTRGPVDTDSTRDPVDTDSSPEPVGHSLLRSVGGIYDGSLFDDYWFC